MNYYELLNVKETASVSEIKKSYKALVKKYHPDVYDGDKTFAEKKLKEINQAYEILSDQSSRAEYDRVLNSVREETSKLYNDYNQENSNEYDDYDYQKQKEDLEKKYNEMYNYDYYKRYTTNYYGVDKSSERYKNTSNYTSSGMDKIKSVINHYVSNTQIKILIPILGLLLIIGLIVAISLLSKVKDLLTDSKTTLDEEILANTTTNEYNKTEVFAPNYNSTVEENIIEDPYIRMEENIFNNNYIYENYLSENSTYEGYTDYLNSLLGGDFDGIIKKGVTIFQVYAFYGEPDRYYEENNLIYLYYQDSYIVFDNYGNVVNFENNGYFMTEEDLNSINEN